MRPAIATSPRSTRSSSICVTLRLFVHRRSPRDHAGVREVARRQRARALEPLEDVAPEAVVVAHPDRAAARARDAGHTARGRGRGPIGRTQRVHLDQRAVLLDASVSARAGRTSRAAPRDQVGARRDAVVGSIWSSVSCRTTSSRSVGRGASSSWARTAMRRACSLVSSCLKPNRSASNARWEPPTSRRRASVSSSVTNASACSFVSARYSASYVSASRARRRIARRFGAGRRRRGA